MNLILSGLKAAGQKNCCQGRGNFWMFSFNLVNLRGIYPKRKKLIGVELADANLKEFSFEGANLREANLKGANLEVNLKGANLKWCDLREASCNGADLRDVNLLGSNFERANVIQADF